MGGHRHVVGGVEPSLCFDHVREHAHHVAVLTVELQLHLGLVPLEILRAHRTRVASGWDISGSVEEGACALGRPASAYLAPGSVSSRSTGQMVTNARPMMA